MKNKNHRRAGLFLVMATTLLTGFATRGGFQQVRGPDALGLLAIGMMIGVAIANLVTVLRSS